MSLTTTLSRQGLALSALFICSSALATNGSIPHGYGVKSEGMGGAGAALPQDAMIGASNPAGMVHIGNRIDAGMAVLNVDNGAYFAGQKFSGSYRRDTYVIPQGGINYMLSDNTSIGLTAVGNGVGIDYRPFDTIGGMTNPASEFVQLVATTSLSHKFNDKHSVGVGLLLINQTLDIDGTDSLGLPQGRDTAYGAGLRVGWLGKITDHWNVAASYTTKGYMQKMGQFEHLLPENGRMDLAANMLLGTSYHVNNWTLAFDYARWFWDDTRAYSNPGVSTAGIPGTTAGPGFGWKNQHLYRLGASYRVNEQWTLRAGYSYATKLVDQADTYLNLLAPAANRRHVTLGLTYTLPNGNEISAAYAKSFKETIHGEGLPPDALTDVYMGQDWLAVSYSMKF